MRLLTVMGARPQFVKHAPVSRELRRRGDLAIDDTIVHTGQHHDIELSQRQFEALGLPAPDVNLGVHGGSPTDALGRMLQALDVILVEVKPDAVLVYGDTTSTLAGAISAANRDIPLIHVEAGLRSFDRTMPEERNRVLTDRLASLLFAPTETAVGNLELEGITDGVHRTGDVMLDAFLQTPSEPEAAKVLLDRIGIKGAFVLATLHRAESTTDAGALSSRLEYIVKTADGLPVILPLHPRTRDAAERFRVNFGSVHVVEPLDYRVFAALLANCLLVITDSGGVQKEAYFHRVPCVTLRSATEWPETVDAGWNRLWDDSAWRAPRTEITDYGVGNAAEKIVATIQKQLGV